MPVPVLLFYLFLEIIESTYFSTFIYIIECKTILIIRRRVSTAGLKNELHDQ